MRETTGKAKSDPGLSTPVVIEVISYVTLFSLVMNSNFSEGSSSSIPELILSVGLLVYCVMQEFSGCVGSLLAYVLIPLCSGLSAPACLGSFVLLCPYTALIAVPMLYWYNISSFASLLAVSLGGLALRWVYQNSQYRVLLTTDAHFLANGILTTFRCAVEDARGSMTPTVWSDGFWIFLLTPVVVLGLWSAYIHMSGKRAFPRNGVDVSLKNGHMNVGCVISRDGVTDLALLVIVALVPLLLELSYWIEQVLAISGLVVYWAVITPIGVVVIHTLSFNHKFASRKMFHVLLWAVLLPMIIRVGTDPSVAKLFTYVLVSISIVLLVIEHTRRNYYLIGSAPIHNFLSHFADERDDNELVLTHFFLFLGCTVPLIAWMRLQEIGLSISPLVPFGGLLPIGVGDAFAALVGKRYGRHKWPGQIGTRKTSVEGTAAFIVSTLCVAVCLEGFAILSSLPVVCGVVFAAFLEAYCPHIDNLYIPLYFMAWLLLS